MTGGHSRSGQEPQQGLQKDVLTVTPGLHSDLVPLQRAQVLYTYARMNYKFRKVDLSDDKELRFIAEIDSMIPGKFDSDFLIGGKPVEDRLVQFREKFEADDFFEVATDDSGKIIGFHAVRKSSYVGGKQAGYIFTLWVLPQYRGRGIGRTFKERSTQWARTLNLDYLITSVHPHNQRMLDLNKEAGFEVASVKMKLRL